MPKVASRLSAVIALPENHAGKVLGELVDGDTVNDVGVSCDLEVPGFITPLPIVLSWGKDILTISSTVSDFLCPNIDAAKMATPRYNNGIRVAIEDATNSRFSTFLPYTRELQPLIADDSNPH
jgi:hypothetical protein